MGWDFQHVAKGTPTIDVVRSNLNGEYEIIDHAVKGGAVYLAVRSRDDHDHVEGVVVLYKRDSRSYYNFGMKWMDEAMGPYNYECPDRILDLLSPTAAEHALAWRAACRAVNAKVRESKAVKHGTVIEFSEPLRFSDGRERSRFTYESTEKCFVAEDGVMVKISGWRKRPFTIVGQAA